MADTKISALTASTTPLAGTEVLPIVQSSTTKQVSVANLTAGRAVSAASVTTTGTITANSGIRSITASGRQPEFVLTQTSIASWTMYNPPSSTELRLYNGTDKIKFIDTGDVNLTVGNLIIGTSGKGIDFSATPGTGTSELLADYEEGTWTPSIGGTATYTAQTGRYTKIGRLVTFMGDLTINVQGTGNAGAISGLPFTVLGNNPVYVGYFSNLGQAVSSISPFTGGTDVLLYGILVAASTASNLTIMTSGARLMFQGSYEV